MADIKQAAKWLDEGKQIRRPYLADNISLGVSSAIFSWPMIRVFENGKVARDQRSACFTSADLLADDWELAGKDTESR